MKIAICGSMAFAKEMLEIKDKLEAAGHVCFVPYDTEAHVKGLIKKLGGSEGAKRKIAFDLIRKHYDVINSSDAILLLNYNKGRIKNYIGGNAFLEMGYAYIMRKKIFLMNDIPETKLLRQEVQSMQPIIIHGDLSKIV